MAPRPTAGSSRQAFELVASVGVPVAPWRYARTAGVVHRGGDPLGPFVVKGDVDGPPQERRRRRHPRPRRAEAASEAYGALVARFGDRLRGAIVQAQAAPGLELLVGVARHPGFGPVVLVGAGGTEAELRNDLAVLVAPVSTAAATRAIDGLRLAPLLHGYRGRAPLPVERVADLVHRVSLLAVAVPELDQLDLNPVIVDPGRMRRRRRPGVAVIDDAAPVKPLRGMRGRVGKQVGNDRQRASSGE